MAKAEKETFENKMTQLEKIVEKMEQEQIKLDDAIKLYEEGMTCALFCSKKLNEVRQRIDVIRKKSDGAFERVPFDTASIISEEE